MLPIPTPYDTLQSHLCQVLSGVPGIRITQIRNLALWVWGLVKARSCHLGRVADQLPVSGSKPSRIRRLKRFLMNPRILIDAIYGRIVQKVLERWHKDYLTLAIDRTDWDAFNILFVGIPFVGRTIPLAWTVLDHEGNSSFQEQKALLERIRPWIPAHLKVGLLGDGEFRSVELMRYVQSLGWDFGLGQAEDTYVVLPKGRRCQLRDLAAKPGQVRFFEGVYLTDLHLFGPVNLICYWDREKKEARFMATNLPATHKTFRWGKTRSWIEGTFRDYKSQGFDLEATRLVHADRLQKLLLVMAVAYVWMYHVGRWVLRTGRRKQLDAAPKRSFSFFRLGLDWITQAISRFQPIKVGFAPYS